MARLVFLILVVVMAVVRGHVPHVPLPSRLIPVPLYRQQTDYSCGPSSALSLLRYWNWPVYQNVTEFDLYGPMNCTEQEGTDPPNIADYFVNVAGIPAAYVSGENITLDMLKAAIDAGTPPIIDLQAWPNKPVANWTIDWKDGHYNVLIGYDDVNFYYMDPSTSHHYAFVPQVEFFERWHDTLGGGCPRKPCEKVQHMVVFVKGSDIAPHPETDYPPWASYEA